MISMTSLRQSVLWQMLTSRKASVNMKIQFFTLRSSFFQQLLTRFEKLSSVKEGFGLFSILIGG